MLFSDWIRKNYQHYTEQDVCNNLDELFELFFNKTKQRLFEGIEEVIKNEVLSFQESHGLYVTMANEKVKVVILLDQDDTLKKEMKFKDIQCWDMQRIEVINPKEYD